jgi:hypothetical protein
MTRLLCLFGFHAWRQSRFVALGQLGSSWVCQRCHKHVEGLQALKEKEGE